MPDRFSRSQLLLGAEGMKRLQEATVAVFGIGGVGSFAAEALARSGVGKLVLFDNDAVSVTNINRQLIATDQTVGRLKVEVMRERIRDINPQAEVEIHPVFFTAENAASFDMTSWSYAADAIDTVSSKLTLIELAKAAGVPVISCMGAGNKLDPTKFEVTDIYKTSVCPLAKVMRHELRKRGIRDLKVVYSTELALTPDTQGSDEELAPGSSRRQIPGSVSFVPSVAGLILAGEIIKDIALGQNAERL